MAATFTSALPDKKINIPPSDVTFGQAKNAYEARVKSIITRLNTASLPIMQVKAIHEEANPL